MKIQAHFSLLITLFLAAAAPALSKKVNKQGTRTYEQGKELPGLKLVRREDRRLEKNDLAQLAEGVRRLTTSRRRLGAKKGHDLVSFQIAPMALHFHVFKQKR